MATLARIELEDGGSVLLEAPDTPDGPVKAGRISEAIYELPANLQAALQPVTNMAKAVLDELRKAAPAEVTVEFGVDLAVQAGAVITKGEASCHLNVTVMWKREASADDQR